MNVKLKNLVKPLTLTVPVDRVIQQKSATSPAPARAYEGEPVVVWTQPAAATMKAMLGTDGALSAALVQLGLARRRSSARASRRTR